MNETRTNRRFLLKSGVEQRIYLMFAGKRKASSESALQLRPHGVQKLIPAFLLLVAGCMIGIVLWHEIASIR